MTDYKTQYWQRKTMNLCVRCGKIPPVDNEVLCADCKAYYAKRNVSLSEAQRNKRRETHNQWCKNNPDEVSERGLRYRIKLKHDVIGHYGNACACCGETEYAFLTLDHIEGGGNIHRRKLNAWGNGFYRRVRSLGYPPGLQVLCWNCNMAKAHFGKCPHSRP